jgi:hypothetical protein
MSENPSSAPRRALHLVLGGFPAERLDEIARADNAEIFPLTETTAKEALEKIFAADTIAVWTKLQ